MKTIRQILDRITDIPREAHWEPAGVEYGVLIVEFFDHPRFGEFREAVQRLRVNDFDVRSSCMILDQRLAEMDDPHIYAGLLELFRYAGRMGFDE
jgi:hypothetical protein